MSLKPPDSSNPGVNGNADGYTSGEAPVWDGSGFAPTDIASQTELNTHAALTTSAHGGIVADTDSRLAISVKDQGAVGDGSTDDTTAFTAAATALTSASGGTLIIPPGTYILNDDLALPSNTHVIGYGQPTLKVKASSTSNPLLLGVGSSESDITVEGITFDGNRSNITSTNNLITIAGATRVRFVRCVFTNTRGVTLVFGGTGGCEQSGALFCRFFDCGTLNRTTDDLDDRHQAISYSGGGDRNYVHFCDFETIGLDCISFASSESSCSAIGNTISDTDAGSIYVSTSTDFRVEGNYISNGDAGGNAIDLHDSTDGAVVGNVCIGNGGTGILIAGCERLTVTGNVCKNNDQQGTDTVHRGGITFDSSEADSTTSNVIVSGNICTDDQAAPTQLYAIGIHTGDGTLDPDSIRINDSNLLESYDTDGSVLAANRLQSTDLGAQSATQIVALAASGTFTVASADYLFWVDVANISSTAAARFFVNTTVVHKVEDELTAWAATDTGTTNALYSDGAGSIVLKNRAASSKSYVITVRGKVRMA